MKPTSTFFILFLILYSCQSKEANLERIKAIGTELMTKKLDEEKEILNIVNLSQDLKDKILELKKNSSEYSIVVRKGDFSQPFGDGNADTILIIVTDFKDLQVRLKQSITSKKYHILGWRSLNNNQTLK